MKISMNGTTGFMKLFIPVYNQFNKVMKVLNQVSSCSGAGNGNLKHLSIKA